MDLRIWKEQNKVTHFRKALIGKGKYEKMLNDIMGE
jgi:hypothetical protein